MIIKIIHHDQLDLYQPCQDDSKFLNCGNVINIPSEQDKRENNIIFLVDTESDKIKHSLRTFLPEYKNVYCISTPWIF